MLFDDNVGFITFNLDNSKYNDFKNSNFEFEYESNRDNILSPEEGFMRGNMFKNEYKPYKNYTYRRLVPSDRREKLLFEVMELCFAIDDLNLMLDLHPNDAELNRKFNMLVSKACEKEKEYVNTYGPLMVKDSDSDKFTWINSPWPWNDKGGSKYV